MTGTASGTQLELRAAGQIAHTATIQADDLELGRYDVSVAALEVHNLSVTVSAAGAGSVHVSGAVHLNRLIDRHGPGAGVPTENDTGPAS